LDFQKSQRSPREWQGYTPGFTPDDLYKGPQKRTCSFPDGLLTWPWIEQGSSAFELTAVPYDVVQMCLQLHHQVCCMFGSKGVIMIVREWVVQVKVKVGRWMSSHNSSVELDG
jgi:hypothetical protein